MVRQIETKRQSVNLDLKQHGGRFDHSHQSAINQVVWTFDILELCDDLMTHAP